MYIYIYVVSFFVCDLLNEKHWTDLHAKVYKFITFEANDKCCTFLRVLSRSFVQ